MGDNEGRGVGVIVMILWDGYQRREPSLHCCIGGRKRGRRKGRSLDAEVVDEVDGGGSPHEARGDEVARVQCICH